jgi:ATP-dependent Lon protease
MDTLDKKLNEVYPGRVVRKDLLHRIKKGTNVPSFVLEFLLAKYCASDDPDEIESGIQAVFETLERNYVRPGEANKAQSTVQQKGKHKFIDKLHVTYREKEKRHWAEMENFGSRRIAIPAKFYQDNDRLLEGGIWAEVTVGHNDIDEDNYAFYIEDLRPIQLSRFDADAFLRGREAFNRDEWLDSLIRTMGLEPSRFSLRIKFHFLARLFPFVEANYNFIELGPRGTGKSYAFSEFSPYSTLVSQASTPTLFYNNARQKVGLVGYWDVVAFDEVGRVKIKDRETVDILKSYMASGRFSRGVEVVANASLAFVGNIDHAIDQLVNSAQYDLFIPLPREFDLAVIDRFFTFLPGWEMPKTSSEFLTEHYGFITDYLSEAFHLLAKQTRYDYVTSHCKLGPSIEGRDEIAIKRTIAAMLKLLHPSGEPSRQELEEYMAYAIEGRRRIKEQLNKRKQDDEYARVNLSFFDAKSNEVIVWCPESKDVAATQNPERRRLPGSLEVKLEGTHPQRKPLPQKEETEEEIVVLSPIEEELKEEHYTIRYGDIGHSYESIFGKYLTGCKSVVIEDPYVRLAHQIQNLVRFCELAAKADSLREIRLITGVDNDAQKADVEEKFEMLHESLRMKGVEFKWTFSPVIHDRAVKLDNGWTIKIGRGLDIYQKPENWYSIGSNDFDLRPCLETTVDSFRNG